MEKTFRLRLPINGQESSDCNVDQFREETSVYTVKNIYMALFRLCLEDEGATSE